MLAKIIRLLVWGAVFFLPEHKRIAIDRRLRGREEFRKLQKSDCVIVSYGKSGRTWLRVMLSRFYQLKHGLPDNSLIAFDNLQAKNRDIPLIFFSHDNYLKDFTGNADSKKDYYQKKVVLLVRDPRDVAVSQYFQWKHRMHPWKKRLNKYPAHDSDISEYEFAMDQNVGLPKIVEFLNLWADEAGKIDQLLVVRYEDMRKDTAGVLGQILDFIGSPASAVSTSPGSSAAAACPVTSRRATSQAPLSVSSRSSSSTVQPHERAKPSAALVGWPSLS